MIRAAAKTFLSSSTEIGDSTVKFVHRVVQVLASVFIAKKKFPSLAGFLYEVKMLRSSFVSSAFAVSNNNRNMQQQNFIGKNC
jgi:hypothetical protein